MQSHANGNFFADDENENGVGNICSSNQDVDADGVDDNVDNCPGVYNPEQLDEDKDELGNKCDDDMDGDGVVNDVDNCKFIPNRRQEDSNDDGKGDACEKDEEGDQCVSVCSLL